jgi:hypothetical protein
MFFTKVFRESLIEKTIGFSAAGAAAVLAPHVSDFFTDVPWVSVVSAAVTGGVLGALTGLASLKVGPGKDNGNTSFNSKIVAG